LYNNVLKGQNIQSIGNCGFTYAKIKTLLRNYNIALERQYTKRAFKLLKITKLKKVLN